MFTPIVALVLFNYYLLFCFVSFFFLSKSKLSVKLTGIINEENEMNFLLFKVKFLCVVSNVRSTPHGI